MALALRVRAELRYRIIKCWFQPTQPELLKARNVEEIDNANDGDDDVFDGGAWTAGEL